MGNSDSFNSDVNLAELKSFEEKFYDNFLS